MGIKSLDWRFGDLLKMILKIGQDGGSTGEWAWRGEITTNPSKVAKYLINFSSSVLFETF